MPDKLKLTSTNNKSFQGLLEFGESILNICRKLKITPIAYGSLAYFYHTHDKNISINDLDLLVPESSFPEIVKTLEQKNISYKQMEWPSIVAANGNFKIDLDSIERYLDPRSRASNVVKINNLVLNILNIGSLIDIYQETVDNMPNNIKFEQQRDRYTKKLKNLKNVK